MEWNRLLEFLDSIKNILNFNNYDRVYLIVYHHDDIFKSPGKNPS